MLGSLELELQMIVNHHVGAGNQTQFYKGGEGSYNHWTISTAHKLKFKIFSIWLRL